MFKSRVRNPFGCRGVSCVKLPAAVAFPTDVRLLERIEESRRALPVDNMKALRKRREPFGVVPESAQRVRVVDAKACASPAEVDRALSTEPRSPSLQLVRVEQRYNRVA
jgi:hypothetical protein